MQEVEESQWSASDSDRFIKLGIENVVWKLECADYGGGRWGRNALLHLVGLGCFFFWIGVDLFAAATDRPWSGRACSVLKIIFKIILEIVVVGVPVFLRIKRCD